MRRLREESLKYDIPWYTECLEHLMHHPPETMYQVLEAVYLFLTLVEIGVENARSLGIIDLLYYPYYKADIESGRYPRKRSGRCSGTFSTSLTLQGVLPRNP